MLSIFKLILIFTKYLKDNSTIIMKNYLFLILLFIASANDGFAQLVGEDSIAIIAYWEQDDQQKYEYTKRTLEQNNDEKAENEQTQKTVSFTIKEATPENYLVEYKTENLLGDNPAGKIPGVQEIIQKLTEELRYEYVTDEMGEFIELKNWKEVSDANIKLTKMLMGLQGGTSKERKKAKEAAKSMINQMIGTQEGMETFMRKEINPFILYHGYVFPLNMDTEYDEEVSNLFGGENFPARGTFKIIELDKENHTVKFASTLSMDSEKSKEILAETMKKMFDRLSESMGETQDEEELNKMLKNMKYEMTEESYIIYDYETGWVLESKDLRKTTLNMSGEKNIYKEEEKTFKIIK